MSTQRQFLKPQKVSKKPQLPETEDDYLAAGVKEEEGGEKWRAGDAQKSSRFFVRALDIYDSGLKKHPKSFDLAYNKARLQYDTSQQPRLVAYQPQPLIELLSTALQSHRYALTLESEDADAIFNTAQVMVSISETLTDTSISIGTHDREHAVPLLQEAISLFQNCFKVQNSQYAEAEAAIEAQASSPPNRTTSSPPPQVLAESETEETWASVKESVTSSTLLDTILAEIHAWTILLPLLSWNLSLFDEIASKAKDVLDRASTIVRGAVEQQTYEQAYSNLKAALADAAYKSGAMTAADCAATLDNIWASCTTLISFGPALCDHADALATLNTSLSADMSPDIANIRWKALSMALRLLATADKNPGPVERSIINARRGDIELLRTRLGDPPIVYEQATKSRTLLIKNAETYYDGARKLIALGEDTTLADTMTAKCVIAKALREGNMDTVFGNLSIDDQSKIQTVITEMVEEGLLPP